MATRYAAHTIQKQLDAICSQMEHLAAESRAGFTGDLDTIDKRVDALISAVGTLAYLASRLAEQSA